MPETTGMQPVERLVPFDEARRQLHALMPPTHRTETVPVAAAHGRVIANDLRAPIDVPAFDRSAMDGYAVRASDTTGATPNTPTALRLAGAVHAGPAPEVRLRGGDCVQIATGAPIPAGADAVVMVERTRRVQDQVWIQSAVSTKENVSPRGGDLRRGDVAIPHESTLTPARLGVLSALGVTQVSVYARPRVALISTGSELREPGERLEPGLIYDSNSTSLLALLESNGAKVDRGGIVADDPKVLRAALTRFRSHDAILVTGSSSAGERDYLAETLRTLGSIVFHGVSVKPGKPLLLARVFAKPLVGLAGNPASCLMMSYALVVPALRRFQHLPPDADRRVRARLGQRVASPPGRRHFVPVRLREGVAESVYKESDATTSTAAADGYIEVPDEADHVDEGSVVIVHLF